MSLVEGATSESFIVSLSSCATIKSVDQLERELSEFVDSQYDGHVDDEDASHAWTLRRPLYKSFFALCALEGRTPHTNVPPWREDELLELEGEGRQLAKDFRALVSKRLHHPRASEHGQERDRLVDRQDECRNETGETASTIATSNHDVAGQNKHPSIENNEKLRSEEPVCFDKWLEAALIREADRGDNFVGVPECLYNSTSFDPVMRAGAIGWFREVCRICELGPIILEIASFFLDAFISVKVVSGDIISKNKYKVMATVAMHVAAKIYGVGNLHLAAFAPHFKMPAPQLAEIEIELMQTFGFNLLIPSTNEFTFALIQRLESSCTHLMVPEADGNVKFEEMRVFGGHFAELFVENIDNIEYSQSMKSLAAATLAVARWSVCHLSFSCGADEADTLESILSSFSTPNFVSDPVVAYVLNKWHEVVEGVKWIKRQNVDILLQRLINQVRAEVCAESRYPSTPSKRFRLSAKSEEERSGCSIDELDFMILFQGSSDAATTALEAAWAQDLDNATPTSQLCVAATTPPQPQQAASEFMMLPPLLCGKPVPNGAISLMYGETSDILSMAGALLEIDQEEKQLAGQAGDEAFSLVKQRSQAPSPGDVSDLSALNPFNDDEGQTDEEEDANKKLKKKTASDIVESAPMFPCLAQLMASESTAGIFASSNDTKEEVPSRSWGFAGGSRKRRRPKSLGC